MDGAIVIDKSAGMTSHDVVARLRRILNERSIGHLGTLDPDATGVLPLLVGRLTRLAQYFQQREKEYEVTIRFGFATDTYDAAGDPAGPLSHSLPTRDAVEAALVPFRGRIQQTPPPFSAKKVGGVPAYKMARRKQPLTLTPVEVEVKAFEITSWDPARPSFRIHCASGTYVRSLAHDLGQALGVGAHVSALRRTRVGEFTLAASHTLESLESMAALSATGSIAAALLPATALLPEFPGVVAPLDAQSKLLQGRAANLPEFSQARLVRVFAPDQRLIAIASRIAGSLFQPRAVFPPQA